jgi:cysteine desulfurase family protein (TIGR01976 family)
MRVPGRPFESDSDPAASARIDVERVRARFPALSREMGGRGVLYFDGPAGSQVPRSVADAVRRTLLDTNANSHGVFASSEEVDALLSDARCAVSDLIGAPDPESIVFGANMTTLTFAFSRAIAATWRSGDEIVVTRAEHDANRTPWSLAARDRGAVVREVAVDSEGRIDVDDLERKLSSKTRLVAVGAASNLIGTIQPIQIAIARARSVGARVFVDAVHLVPHRLVDFAALDADVLVFSAYKVFGPHVGVLCGRREILEEVEPYKVRPAPETLPDRWMTGTQNHEGIAGTRAAVAYLADLGRELAPGSPTRRSALAAAFESIALHESELAELFLSFLRSDARFRLYGVAHGTDPHRRVATMAFVHRKIPPDELARSLAKEGIFVWSGNSYAVPIAEALRLGPEGVVRVGFLHYNSRDEVHRLIDVLDATGAR